MPDEPLDAYVTAKPGEPTFSLQGGDPLAPALVRLWAQLARVQCGIISPTAVDCNEVINNAVHKAELPSVSEQADLQLRATKAEELSWDMDAYLKGQSGAEPETSGEKLSVPERLDLFDVRVRMAAKISESLSVINDMREIVEDAGFRDPLFYANISSIMSMLKVSYNLVQPKRDWHWKIL